MSSPHHSPPHGDESPRSTPPPRKRLLNTPNAPVKKKRRPRIIRRSPATCGVCSVCKSNSPLRDNNLCWRLQCALVADGNSHQHHRRSRRVLQRSCLTTALVQHDDDDDDDEDDDDDGDDDDQDDDRSSVLLMRTIMNSPSQSDDLQQHQPDPQQSDPASEGQRRPRVSMLAIPPPRLLSEARSGENQVQEIEPHDAIEAQPLQNCPSSPDEVHQNSANDDPHSPDPLVHDS